MSAVDVLVTLLFAGLVVRYVAGRTARSAELPSVREGSPLPTAREAARLYGVEGMPGLVYEYRGKFDLEGMVQMLREQGYIDEATARELLGEP